MLPGKTLTPEDMLGILRRRIWLVLVPLAVVAATTAVVSRLLPDRYKSETLILVVPQRVPESYVKSTVTARIEDRLQSIIQQILSRTRLERIIQDFNLYPDERKTGIMEEVVEGMRKDITVQVVKGDAFRVSYAGRDPRTVMRVTERLASLFIEENLRDREILAEGTNSFLETQLDDARRRLIEQEKKLEEYRKRFSGQLPTQTDTNLQSIQNTQLQIQAIVESLNRDKDRRLLLQRQIADVEQDISTAETVRSTSTRPAAVVTTPDEIAATGNSQQQLESAKASLASMELRLKADHPDVVRMKRMVRDLETKVAAESKDAVSPLDVQRKKRLADLRLELSQVDSQIAAKQDDEVRLRAQATAYQARVDAAPTRESEMTELMRDYKTLQDLYASLLAKKEDSKIAANLERRQIGEQFKLLDPAQLPEVPFTPNRILINGAGVAGGFALGLMLIALAEYRDNTFKSEQDVTSVLRLPVLAIVPVMESTTEHSRAFRRRLMLNFGLSATVLACVAVVVYTLVR